MMGSFCHNNKTAIASLAVAAAFCTLVLLAQREDIADVLAHDNNPEAAYFSDAAILTQWPAKKHPHELKMAAHELGAVGSRDSSGDDLLQVIPDTTVDEDGAREMTEMDAQSAELETAITHANTVDRAAKEKMAAVQKEAQKIASGTVADEDDTTEAPPWARDDLVASDDSDTGLTEMHSEPAEVHAPAVVQVTVQAHTVAIPATPETSSMPRPGAESSVQLQAAREISAKANTASRTATLLQNRAKEAWSEVPQPAAPTAQLMDTDEHKKEPYNAPAPAPATTQTPPMKMDRDSYDPSLWRSSPSPQTVKALGEENLYTKETTEKVEVLAYETHQKQAFKLNEDAVHQRAANQKMEQDREAAEEKADKSREALAARKAAADAAKAKKERVASAKAWNDKLADAEAVGRERGNKAADAKQAAVEHLRLQVARQQQADALDKAAAKQRAQQTVKIQQEATAAEERRLKQYRRKAEELVDKALVKGKST